MLGHVDHRDCVGRLDKCPRPQFKHVPRDPMGGTWEGIIAEKIKGDQNLQKRLDEAKKEGEVKRRDGSVVYPSTSELLTCAKEQSL